MHNTVSYRSERFFSIASLGIISRLAILNNKRLYVFNTNDEKMIKAIDNRHDSQIEKIEFKQSEKQNQINDALNFYEDLSNFENNGRLRYIWLKNWIYYADSSKKSIRDNAELQELYRQFLTNGKINAEDVLKWKSKGCPR